MEPEELFDQVVDRIQDVQKGIPMEQDVRSEPESDFVICSSKDAIQTLQTYAKWEMFMCLVELSI